MGIINPNGKHWGDPFLSRPLMCIVHEIQGCIPFAEMITVNAFALICTRRENIRILFEVASEVMRLRCTKQVSVGARLLLAKYTLLDGARCNIGERRAYERRMTWFPRSCSCIRVEMSEAYVQLCTTSGDAMASRYDWSTKLTSFGTTKIEHPTA
jgi:hypothetical protein